MLIVMLINYSAMFHAVQPVGGRYDWFMSWIELWKFDKQRESVEGGGLNPCGVDRRLQTILMGGEKYKITARKK